MPAMLEIGGIALEVVRKDIKNVHLSVYPPRGRVRISAPTRMSLETIRLFAISKLSWIRREQRKLQAQERETQREYLNRESHYVWGQRYLLKIVEGAASTSVELKHRCLLLRTRSGADEVARKVAIAGWYRQQLRTAVQSLIEVWEPKLMVQVNSFFVQQMKTRWGSCNKDNRTIRLNTELAKKPAECLEYIVVHEMAHLIEPTHGPRFIALMDRFLPSWRDTRDLLNQLPAKHEQWVY